MDKIWLVLKEQFDHLKIIFRIAKYENKAVYQGAYLGGAWEILNPLLQVLTFYLIFGIGLRSGGLVNGVPFLVWLVIGQASWMFISGCVNGGSTSVKGKLALVSKMKFPISVLPTILIISKLKSFFVVLGLGLVTAFLMAGILPTLHWLQFIYYFIAMIVFLLFLALLTSTVNIIFNDFQYILGVIMRIMFFLSGIMFPLEDMQGRLGALFQLNPFHYLMSGFRGIFLFQMNFWERPNQTLFFWAFTLMVGLIGAHLHLKFRAKFSDFL